MGLGGGRTSSSESSSDEASAHDFILLFVVDVIDTRLMSSRGCDVVHEKIIAGSFPQHQYEQWKNNSKRRGQATSIDDDAANMRHPRTFPTVNTQ